MCRQNLDDVTLEQVMVQTLDIIGKSDKNSKIPKVGFTNRSLCQCKTLPAHFSDNMIVYNIVY